MVSKSYYAVLTAMRAMLSVKGLDSQRHEGVITLFHKHFVKQGIFPPTFNAVIAQLKKRREEADYGDFVTMTRQMAEVELSHAEKFLIAAKEVLSRLISGEGEQTNESNY